MEQVTDAGYVQVQTELPDIYLRAREYLENRSSLGLLFPEQSTENGNNGDSSKFVASG